MGTLDGLKGESSKKTTFCASRPSWDEVGVVTYDKLFVDSNNIVNGELNPGQQHKVWVQKMGNSLPDTLMSSSCNVMQFYGMSDNGSKDVVLELAAGDKVNLFHTTGDGGLGLANMVFCVQSLKVK